MKDRIQKAWGLSYGLYQDDSVELMRIEVRVGGYSSRHYHRYKHNTFQVVQGRLLVIRYENGHRAVCTLTSDDGPHAIPAGVEHRFQAIEEATIAFETYHPVAQQCINPDDIVRGDTGGILLSEPEALLEEDLGLSGVLENESI